MSSTFVQCHRMDALIDPALERFALQHSTRLPPLLDELAQYTQARFPDDAQMLIGPLEASLLQLLIKLGGARRVLEIGLFTGYSALAMATALPRDGRLLSLDRNAETAAVAREFFARSAHADKIEVRLGDAHKSLAALTADERAFDFVFLDADKESYIDYYETVMPWLAPGGLLVADNVLWSGRVLAPERASDRAVVAFNAHVVADARVEATLLTVRDGVYLVRKK